MIEDAALAQPTAMRGGLRRSEAVAVVVLAAVGSLLGAWNVRALENAGVHGSFYQVSFGPALMVACGRGYIAPDAGQLPDVAEFLDERSRTFDCDRLPSPVPTVPLDAFQRATRYLETTAGVIWRIGGISWSGLIVLPAVLCGAVVVLTYGILRLALSPLIALPAAVLSTTATPNLVLMPHIRDYAKGPFLLALILVMGWIVVVVRDRARLVALAAAAGCIAGLGFGVRTDVILAVVPVMVTLGLLASPEIDRNSRLAAIAVFLVTFSICALPIARGYSQGGNTGHVALLGLAAEFDGTLRVEPSIYRFAGQYNDSLAFSIINSYAVRIEGNRAGVALGSVGYEHSARAYLAQIARTFPADLLTRVIASVRTVPRYFLDSSLAPPPYIASNAARVVYRVRASILSRLAPFAVIAVILALAAAAVTDWRYGLIALLVLTGFAGASALQFHERHFYYLQFIPWMAFGSVLQFLIWRSDRRVSSRRAGQLALIVVVAAAGATAALAAARAYQQRAAQHLFATYESAARSGIAFEQIPATGGRTLATTAPWQSSLPNGSPWIVGSMLAVEFRDDTCRGEQVLVRTRYAATYSDADLSEEIAVPLAGTRDAATTLFIATYDRGDESIRFRGIEFDSGRSECIGGLSKVVGLERTPLLLTTVLAADWRSRPLYQRLR